MKLMQLVACFHLGWRGAESIGLVLYCQLTIRTRGVPRQCELKLLRCLLSQIENVLLEDGAAKCSCRLTQQVEYPRYRCFVNIPNRLPVQVQRTSMLGAGRQVSRRHVNCVSLCFLGAPRPGQHAILRNWSFRGLHRVSRAIFHVNPSAPTERILHCHVAPGL